MFQLDQRLENDTSFIASFELCDLRLHNDGRYPWLILVPRVPDVTDAHQLTFEQHTQLIRESRQVCELMHHLFKPTKMNVAAIGNIVRQLHVHHVARFAFDDAWPNPIWGHGEAKVRSEHERISMTNKILSGLVD